MSDVRPSQGLENEGIAMSGVTEHLRPEEGELLSEDEFARTSGLPREQVRELEAYGLMPHGRLDLPTALALREAVHLKNDFDLDLFSTGLVAGYIEKIRELQAELGRLRAQRPARSVYTEVSFTAVSVSRSG
jgi:hypothetical protein